FFDAGGAGRWSSGSVGSGESLRGCAGAGGGVCANAACRDDNVNAMPRTQTGAASAARCMNDRRNDVCMIQPRVPLARNARPAQRGGRLDQPKAVIVVAW